MIKRSPSSQSFKVYRIPHERPDETLPTKDVVGSKGYNLMRMSRRGLSVPPGFVFGTDLCRAYQESGLAVLAQLDEVLSQELEVLGQKSGRRFGDRKRPLLVSVRSGAAVSMPGMMETILNVGLNGDTLRGMLRLTGNPRLVADCRRRLIEQYGEVVQGIEGKIFADILANRLRQEQLERVDDFDSQALNDLADDYEDAFSSIAGRDFPTSPTEQIRQAVEAVLRSWSSPRAKRYRKLNGIPDNAGTATIVQQMVFGNAGPDSGSGVGFTRNPSDGTKELYVDYLPNAQGEDVVAGRRNAFGMRDLKQRVPEAYQALINARDTLEHEFGDMQDFEFTVEEGRFYLLQARSGKRTPLAALRIAADLAAEKIITPAAARALVQNIDLAAVEETKLSPRKETNRIGEGIPASAGVAVGLAVFDLKRIDSVTKQGKPAILLRENAETSDLEALLQTNGLVTAHGARTSHAAVIARQLAKPCVVGCQALIIDTGKRGGTFGAVRVEEGDAISIDGGTGKIYLGAIPISKVKPQALIDAIMKPLEERAQ